MQFINYTDAEIISIKWAYLEDDDYSENLIDESIEAGESASITLESYAYKFKIETDITTSFIIETPNIVGYDLYILNIRE